MRTTSKPNKMFSIRQYELHSREHLVKAENAQEALAKFKQREVVATKGLQFEETHDNGMSIEEFYTKFAKVKEDEALPFEDDDYLMSIADVTEVDPTT